MSFTCLLNFSSSPTGVRDPFIVQGEDGKFHLCITAKKWHNILLTYQSWIKTPAVCKIHLNEAVKLLADALQPDEVLQRQIA